jgi:hypothetical protein
MYDRSFGLIANDHFTFAMDRYVNAGVRKQAHGEEESTLSPFIPGYP